MFLLLLATTLPGCSDVPTFHALRRLSFSLACASSLVVFGTTAFAQEDPRKAQAEPAFQEGLALHDRGREEEALAKFKEAYAVFPSPNVLYQIARSEQLLGRFLLAIRHYREALASPLLHPKNAQLAKGFVAEVERKLARVTITGPSGAKVEIGGATVTLPLERPVDVEPGEVVAYGTHEGMRLHGKAVVREGMTGTIALTTTGARVSPSDTTPPPDVAPTRSFWTTGRIVGVAGGGTLLAGGLVGAIVFNGKAGDAEDRIAASRAGISAPDTACTGVSNAACDTRREAEDDRVTSTNLRNASFVAAGVGLVGGVVLFLLSPPRGSDRAAVRPLPHVAPLVSRDVRGLFLFQEF